MFMTELCTTHRTLTISRLQQTLMRLGRVMLLTAMLYSVLCGLHCIGSSSSVISTAAAAENEDELAKSILEKADLIRFPKESFQVDVTVTSSGGDSTEPHKYRIYSKGNENTVVQIVEPAADRGQTMLMKGRDLWVFMPNVSQAVRLSLAQRLTGQVANGDLARANFSGDYQPRLVRTERIGNEDMQVLELIAVDKGVTYRRVMYWVRKSNDYPYKAEFYSMSDRLLKTCRYDGFKQMGGRVRPTRMVMEDALKGGEKSVLEYDAMQLRELPDKLFNKDFLKKLN